MNQVKTMEVMLTVQLVFWILAIINLVILAMKNLKIIKALKTKNVVKSVMHEAASHPNIKDK